MDYSNMYIGVIIKQILRKSLYIERNYSLIIPFKRRKELFDVMSSLSDGYISAILGNQDQNIETEDFKNLRMAAKMAIVDIKKNRYDVTSSIKDLISIAYKITKDRDSLSEALLNSL